MTSSKNDPAFKIAEAKVLLGMIKPITPVTKADGQSSTPPDVSSESLRIHPIRSLNQSLTDSITAVKPSPAAQKTIDVNIQAIGKIIHSQSARKRGMVEVFSDKHKLSAQNPEHLMWANEALRQLNATDISSAAMVLQVANNIRTLEHVHEHGAATIKASSSTMSTVQSILSENCVVEFKRAYEMLAIQVEEYKKTIALVTSAPKQMPASPVPKQTSWFKRLLGSTPSEQLAEEQRAAKQYDQVAKLPTTTDVDQLVNNIQRICNTLSELEILVVDKVAELMHLVKYGERYPKMLLTDACGLKLRLIQMSEYLPSVVDPMEQQNVQNCIQMSDRRYKHLLLSENLCRSDWMATHVAVNGLQQLVANVQDIVVVVQSQIIQERNLNTVSSIGSTNALSKIRHSLNVRDKHVRETSSGDAWEEFEDDSSNGIGSASTTSTHTNMNDYLF